MRYPRFARIWPRSLDIRLIVLWLLLTGIGLALAYSGSLADPDLSIFWRQLLFVGIGFVAMLLASRYNYHTLEKNNWIFYLFILLLLILVLVLGKDIRGSNRWLELGFFRLQPSEFAKLLVISGLAIWLGRLRGRINSWLSIILTMLLAGIPAGLVLLQPDLGSSVIIVACWFGILLISPIEKKRVSLIILIALAAAVLAWKFVLLDFQRDRLQTFLNPGADPAGRGYNVRQAVIAVGNGRLWGQGLGQGAQSQLKFLPERQTDFIFATASEEIGFAGSGFILILYGLLAWRLLQITKLARDDMGTYLAFGIFCLFTFQAGVNIAMNMGLAPVTGIPLPFLSYGGSSFLVSSLALGLAQNIVWQSKTLRN